MLAVVAALGVWCAWAGADDVLISFSTVGPDRYADGTTVKDGEWYALCWTTNALFGGLTTTGGAAVAGDRVLLAAPLAVGGHCPYTVFQVGEEEQARGATPSHPETTSVQQQDGGRYVVCLLDTRDANGVPTKARLGAGVRVPTMLNGAIATRSYAVEGSAAVRKIAATDVAGTWGETKIDTTGVGEAQAKIAAIEVTGDRVRLTVSGMMPGVRYNIKAGGQVTNLANYALNVPLTKDAQEGVPFLLEASAARFFTVAREPLAR